MLLNIVLSLFVFAAMGCIAHRIVGGSGNLLHNAFVGAAGYGISQQILDILGMLSIGLGWTLVWSLACSCGVILIINRIRHHILINRIRQNQNHSTEDAVSDSINNDNSNT